MNDHPLDISQVGVCLKPLIMLLFFVLLAQWVMAAEDAVDFGAFGRVALYRGPDPVQHVVLFASGDGGWTLGVVDMARSIAQMNSLVAGFDVRTYLKQLEREHEPCSYPAGDLEQLSQFIQKRAGLAEYGTPILFGYSSGATLAYAALVQAPAGTFAAAVSLGFCPDLPLHKPFCKGNGLGWQAGPKGVGCIFLPADNLEAPWIAFQGEGDKVCNHAATEAFVSQVKNGRIVMLPKVGHGFSVQKNWLPQLTEVFRSLTPPPAPEKPAVPASVGDLPLVEGVPQQWQHDYLAVILSGDGGWVSIDKALTQALNEKGVGVVGLNSLRYFWTRRNPDEASQALRRILEYYLSAWKKDKALLVGYSLGADVLPFMVSRLPAELQGRLKKVVLLGPSRSVEFEFHVSEWLGGSSHDALPLLPEVEKIRGLPLLFVRGEDENDSLCDILPAGIGKVVVMKGGHHFGGDYPSLAGLILQDAP